RYVDNSEAPTPQDVKAHLQGGIPEAEITALKSDFDCYKGLKDKLFTAATDGYAHFTEAVKEKADIKTIISESEGKKQVAEDYHNAIETFWTASDADLDSLHGGSLFDFNNNLTDHFVTTLTQLKVLDKYQIRGSFAHFSDMLKSDFRSVQSSGWTAELIPDDELIANEFPEVLKDLKRLENRRDELEAKFAEIADMDPEEWDAEQYEVMPKTIISEIKTEIKELKAQKRELSKQQKALEKRQKSGTDVAKEMAKCSADIAELDSQIAKKEADITHHMEFENELKDCRKKIREIELSKEALADKAREQISDDDARRLITRRWLATLHDNIAVYLETHARRLQQSVELLYEKYFVTLQKMLEERDEATKELDGYLKELGYIVDEKAK
ncbi:MAG: hypothetical protein IKS72_07870, partial [Prevotella sp.]|nr:hypothetical protein [Prevotella sp.]